MNDLAQTITGYKRIGLYITDCGQRQQQRKETIGKHNPSGYRATKHDYCLGIGTDDTVATVAHKHRKTNNHPILSGYQSGQIYSRTTACSPYIISPKQKSVKGALNRNVLPCNTMEIYVQLNPLGCLFDSCKSWERAAGRTV